MAYIYMDESWDLGFNDNGGSQYFIITFLISKSEKDMEIIMKNVRKRAINKKTKIYWTFFHSHKASKNVVKRFLDLTSRRNIFSVVIIVGSLFSSFFSIDDIRIISSFCSFSSLGFN